MTSPQLSLPETVLAELARHPEGIALPRLRKRLDVRMSLLMRTLAWLGEDSIGGVEAAGLVRIETRNGTEIAVLTDRNFAAASPLP